MIPRERDGAQQKMPPSAAREKGACFKMTIGSWFILGLLAVMGTAAVAGCIWAGHKSYQARDKKIFSECFYKLNEDRRRT